jgi:hypothetical protein
MATLLSEVWLSALRLPSVSQFCRPVVELGTLVASVEAPGLCRGDGNFTTAGDATVDITTAGDCLTFRATPAPSMPSANLSATIFDTPCNLRENGRRGRVANTNTSRTPFFRRPVFAERRSIAGTLTSGLSTALGGFTSDRENDSRSSSRSGPGVSASKASSDSELSDSSSAYIFLLNWCGFRVG